LRWIECAVGPWPSLTAAPGQERSFIKTHRRRRDNVSSQNL
jgi:hypothetical protein